MTEPTYYENDPKCSSCIKNPGGDRSLAHVCITCNHLEVAKTDNYEKIKGILPCPFCGAIPDIKASNDLYPFYGIEHRCARKNVIICLKWFTSPLDVIKQWNTRFTKKEEEQECEAE